MNKENLIALVDCNNFYVSCERIFDPSLRGKPVAVLSSNDGCVIARSNEVKALQIPVGAPIFKYEQLIKENNVILRSSNFPLYGDISARIMSILEEFCPVMEVYSIDEAFLVYPGEYTKNAQQVFSGLKKKIYQWVGVPVSIGLAPTKTLAKVAADFAKKHPETDGVAHISHLGTQEEMLKKIKVEDVWGIGRNLALRLQRQGIFIVSDLVKLSDKRIRTLLTISGLKIVTELRGTPCIEGDNSMVEHKSIMSTRSFGHNVTDKEELSQAVSEFAKIAGEKLRKQKSIANAMTVSIRNSKYQNQYYFSDSITISFPHPTDYIPDMIASARRAIDALYKEGIGYKKAGVFILGIMPKKSYQLSFFSPPSESIFVKKNDDVMSAVEQINNKWGRDVVRPLAIGTKKAWQPKKDLVSPLYTTDWNQILTIRI